MLSLHINDIQKDYDAGKYSAFHSLGYERSLLTKLPNSHVFDEELTIKRNRELVIEHNQKVDNLRNLIKIKQAELNNQLVEDVVEYIKENYTLTDKQARVVERYVYDEKHASMSDYFSYIDTFAEFAEKLFDLVED